jgi:hypothetical protein
LIESGVDWGRLVGLAENHGLATILYRRLNDVAPGAVPRPLFARLWGRYESTALRNRAMTDELQALLRRFEEESIPALPFKGPVLALQLYGDVALREFGDLDILVRARDVLRARDLVEAIGYESNYPLSPRWERKLLEDPRHYSFSHRHPGSGFKLELHWKTDCRLFAVPGGGDPWWEQLPLAEFEGTSVRSLAPEELLYGTCMHATRHRWASLGWLCDLAELIRRRPGLDWQKVFDLASGQGTLRMLLLGLELAHRLLEAPIPTLVQSWIAADPGVPAMAGRVIRGLGVTSDPAPSFAGSIPYELAWFRFWPAWMGYILKHTLLPNMADWSRWDLPPALSFLYYPLHFVRLFSKYGLRPDRGFFKD